MDERGKGRALMNESLVDVRVRALRGIEADINPTVIARQKRRRGRVRRREIRNSPARIANESFCRAGECLPNYRSVVIDPVRLELGIISGVECKKLDRACRVGLSV